jgi:DNA-binding NtrC family response regulator
MSGRVLIVEREPSTCERFTVSLRERDFESVCVPSMAAAVEALSHQEFLALIVDLDVEGADACQQASACRPGLPIIGVSAHAQLAEQHNATPVAFTNFLTKPVDTHRLQFAVERAAWERLASRGVDDAGFAALAADAAGHELCGVSAAIKRVRELMLRTSETDVPVLITGEHGTGKEQIARTIHAHSRRVNAPFIVAHCAGVPTETLERTLFGDESGLANDAANETTGLCEQANGGTLFLEDLEELPLSLQDRLRQALQTRSVGNGSQRPFDARIIAGNVRELETAMRQRRFRTDLYYQIGLVQIEVPPLRARRQDIPVLTQHFVTQFSVVFRKPVQDIAPEAADKLRSYAWPGNVRELKTCIGRAVALARCHQIDLDDLPDRVRLHAPHELLPQSEDAHELIRLEELERRYILHALQLLSGNKSLAAQTLGLDRKTLYRKLQQYDLRSAGARKGAAD